jgi:transcriptional regulator with XRE-family HTH domain
MWQAQCRFAEIFGRNIASGLGRYRTYDQSVMSRPDTLKLLNKLSTTELARKSQFSKSYISQVKSGHRPPSQKLLNVLEKYATTTRSNNEDYRDALDLFLESRRGGISPNTVRDYRITLGKAIKVLGLSPSTQMINDFLCKLGCSLGGKYGYFKCIRAFYNWLYSPRAGLGFNSADNPVSWVDVTFPPKTATP